MTETKSVNTIARERVEDLAHRGAEPGWLREGRLAAWEAYLQAPLPSPRDEQWRRTDLSGLNLETLTTLDTGALQSQKQFLSAKLKSTLEFFPDYAGLLSQTSPGPGYVELSDKLSVKGVILTDLKTALEKHAELVRPHLETEVDVLRDGKFGLINKSLFNCGLFLYVPPDLEVEAPFLSGITFGEHPGAIFPRVLIVIGANSKVSVVHMLGSNQDPANHDKPSLVSAFTQVVLEPGAKLSYLELSEFNPNVYSISHSQTKVRQDAQLNSLSVALGGKLIKSNIATMLNEPGATSEVLGTVLGSGSEHYNFNTIQEHNAPDTTSDINFRVALKDAASSIYQGIIRVAKAAQRTNAYQSNKNLLLGGQARADSIPKLEILADDVKCSHGATVGPVDHEQIFYLSSRGLTPAQAEELIVLGFFQQVLARFGLPNAIDWVAELIRRKIYTHIPPPSVG